MIDGGFHHARICARGLPRLQLTGLLLRIIPNSNSRGDWRSRRPLNSDTTELFCHA